MSETIENVPLDLPDGWHQVPGDDIGDGRRCGLASPQSRCFWWVYVKERRLVSIADLNQTSEAGPEYEPVKDCWSLTKIHFIKPVWGVELADLFKPEPELWADDFVVGD